MSRIEKSKNKDAERILSNRRKKRPGKRERDAAKGPYGGKLPHPIRVVQGGAPDTVQQKHKQKGAG